MELGNTLEGITVVSLEQAVAAPYCGLLLADAGARVIKVERPGGDFARGYDSGADGQSAIFAWLNRGKESLCLDLTDPAEVAFLQGVIFNADIILSNLAPGAMDRLGLGVETLRKINPRLITCSLSGYGDTGDAAQMKAYDFLVQGEVGLSSVTGTPDDPARVGVSITDLSTGLTAYSAILRALIQRGRTGEGLDIKLSMFDVLADWMNMPLLAERYGPGAPTRSGLQHSFVAPYGAFVCADGLVLLSVQSDREFAWFCEGVLGDATLPQDPRFLTNLQRFQNRAALDQIINQCFETQTMAQVITQLNAAKIANSRLNAVADLSQHPFLTNAPATIGSVAIEVAALPLRGTTQTPADVPDLGQHTDALRQEFTPVTTGDP